MSAERAPDASGDREVVAEDGPYEVYRCRGGCVHIRIGGVTVRFSLDEYRRLAGTIVDGLVRMEVRGTLGGPPWRQ